jgi:plasmid stabilization system protein ParE
MPGMGHKRADLTPRDVLFWPVHSYLVIYCASKPLRIVRVIHGKRDVKRLLKKP